MDWNWFYSSLAQATAAIVGIFAAFIITKIINIQSEFSRKEARMKELIVISENYRDALKNRRWKWYCNQKTELAMAKIRDRLKNGEPAAPEEFLVAAKFPKFVPRDELLDQISATIEEFAAVKAAADESAYVQIVEPEPDPPPIDDGIHDVLDNEKEQIDAVILKTRRHIRLAKLHLEEIRFNRDEFTLIQNSIIVAGLLFIFGVSLPLSFLRISNGINQMLDRSTWISELFSLKGGLLLLVTGIFLYILAIFWRVMHRMEFNIDDVAALRNDTILTSYSPYLEIKAENKKKLKLWFDEQKNGENDTARDVIADGSRTSRSGPDPLPPKA